MKMGKVDWNDSMVDFIRVKIEKPELLRQLVRREQEYAQRKSTEHKMESLRGKYEQLSAKFKAQQDDYEAKCYLKTQLQKEITRTKASIRKLEADLDKMRQNCESRPQRLSQKEELTRNSISEEFAFRRRHQDLAVVKADQDSLKEDLRLQLSKLIACRIQLTEEIGTSTARLQQLISQQALRKQQKQKQERLEELRSKVKQEQGRRKQLLFGLSEAEEKKAEMRNSRQNYQMELEESTKRIANFVRESKKILLGEEVRSSRKYKDFLKKYRKYSGHQEEALRKKYQKISPEALLLLSPSFSPSKKPEKFEDLAFQVRNSINKNSSPAEFNTLINNCQNLSSYHSQLVEEDKALAAELQSLEEDVQRKTRNLEQLRKSIPIRPR